MATRTTKAAAKALAPAPLAAADVGQGGLMSIWRVRLPAGMTTWGNEPGFEQVTVAEGQALIAAGDAVDPTDPRYLGFELPYREGEEPKGWTWNPPAPPVVTVTVTGFSETNPTNANASETDLAKLTTGDMVLIDQTGGTTIAALDGQTLEVLAKNPGYFSLDLDLSAADTTGVTATATVQA